MDAYSIPLTDEEKKTLFKAINVGLNDFKDHFAGIHSSFDNGYGLVTWSFIYNSIYHNQTLKNGKSLKAKRGGWPLALVFHEKTGYLYAFVKKKNFLYRQKTVHRNSVVYYLQALSSFNNGAENEIPSYQLNSYQTNIDFGICLEEKDNIIEEMLGEYRDQIKRFCVVLFDTDKNEITEFGAVLTNENLDDFYTESWNDCIEVDYKDHLNKDSNETEENDQHDILLEFNDMEEDEETS
ncbi:hypothetical protein CD798_08390 [Bacillaceae bacterium SAOS 7]|nr:hypothetical protein CD798_08390 [Bacillaceae bacterium SAOS 7]